MKKIKDILFWLVMIILAGIAIFFGYKYYYKSFYLPTNTDMISKFSLTDLKYEDVHYGASKEDIYSVLGTPVNSYDYTDENTGNVYQTVYYENMVLQFFNNKLYIIHSTSKDFSFKNIKVGDSKDKVLNSFYQEENTNYAYSSDEDIIGKYIYGNFNIYNLETVKTKEAIFYAYQTEAPNNENVSIPDTNDYYLIYGYMCPPYINEYACLDDFMCSLSFGIKDNLVTSISWSVKIN